MHKLIIKIKLILNKIKYFIKENGVLVYFIISAIILTGTINYNNYIIEREILEAEALKASMYEELTKHIKIYNSILEADKDTLLKVESQIAFLLASNENISNIHIYVKNDRIIYELSFYNADENIVSNNLNEYKITLNNLNKDIQNIWNKNGIYIFIEIDLLEYNNNERTLLISTNSVITYSAFDKQESDGTLQDWINWFYYEYGRYPKNDNELNVFKSEKIDSSLMHKNL